MCRVGEHQHCWHIDVHDVKISTHIKCDGIWGWGIYGLNGWGIYGLNGRGIYNLNGWGIYDLNGRGIYDLNGWDIYGSKGWGSYDKVSYCFFGRYAQKALVFRGVATLSGPRMTMGFGPFELPTRGLLQKGRDHSPPKACFE